MRYDAIILGAGISGLVAAHGLKRAGQRVLVLEKEARIGGAIQTIEAEGFLIERGPNSLRGTIEFLDLIAELGIEDELVAADPRAPAYIWFKDDLHALPMGPGAALRTKLLSWRGKLRLVNEPFIPRRRESDEESIAAFVRRRFGAEVLDNIVTPFISGVYAGDVERLSVQASLARLAELESRRGSVFRGLLSTIRNRQPASARARHRSLRPYRLCSFRRGLKTLPEAIGKSLGDSLLTSTTVERSARINTTGGTSVFEISARCGGDQSILQSNALIIAAPAHAAAQTLKEISPRLGTLLGEIHYNSLVSVPLAYRNEQMERAMDGFGFLATRSGGLRTLGSIWNTSLFRERAPEGWVLLNSFIGGATDPLAVELPDDELRRIVDEDLRRVIGIRGEPRLLPLTRYRRAIPQYIVGHAGLTAQIRHEAQSIPGLILIGNYLDGVSIGDCIERAREAAETIIRLVRH